MARKGLGPVRTGGINREEARIQNASLADLGSLPGVLLLVNTVGKIPNPWTGVGWFVYGLGEGTPDVVGSVEVEVITPGGGAIRIGRFFGLEFKKPGEKPEPHQAALHAAWRSLGIFVATVTSTDEARAAIERCRRGELE